MILTINGGQGGMGGSAYAGGTAGVGGMMAFYNTTYCMLTDSYGGFGGYPGISTATALGDYSGVGGTTGRLGQFNYLFQFLHFIEPASTGQSMYYLAPYLGTGAGRGTPSTGGYVYIYY